MEKIIMLSVSGQGLTAERIETVNATVGLIYCEFVFDQSWNDYPAKLANFKRDNQPMSEAVTVPIVNNRCRVPDELLRYKGCIYVAVQGENTEGQTERTAPAHIIKQTQTITEGRNAIDPTPDQYAQFIEQVQEIIDAKGYVTIEELQEQLDPINAALTKKVERVRLQCSDSLIWDEEGNALTYDEVLELMLDITKYITLTYADSISLQPHGWDGNAVFFMSSYIIGNAAYIDRFIIDSENHCKFTEEELALAKNVPAPYDDTQIKADIEAIDTEVNDVKENLNDLDSSKADKSELDGKVGFTDWATQDKGGVIKTNSRYDGTFVDVSNGGRLRAVAKSFSDYNAMSDSGFVAKGTLENVLAERLKEPQFELIEEVTLASDSVMRRNAEPNGTPYNFKMMKLLLEIPQATTRRSIYFALGYNTFSWQKLIGVCVVFNDGIGRAVIDFDCTNGLIDGMSSYRSGGGVNDFMTTIARLPLATHQIKLNAFTEFVTNDLLPSGTNIKIYGIRA